MPRCRHVNRVSPDTEMTPASDASLDDLAGLDVLRDAVSCSAAKSACLDGKGTTAESMLPQWAKYRQGAMPVTAQTGNRIRASRGRGRRWATFEQQRNSPADTIYLKRMTIP